MQTPQIQALAQSAEYTPHLRLLEIFSYGTYQTYTGAVDQQLPALNEAQTLKLRQLSLLTLARTPRSGLGYEALRAALGLPDARSLEDLVISAVYADLLSAQLDPRNQTVRVSAVSPLRDLEPGSAPAILAQLRAWSGRCEDTLADLEAQVEAIRASAAARHTERTARDAAQARLVADETGKAGGSGGQQQQGGHHHHHHGSAVHGRRQGTMLSQAVAQLRQNQGQGQRYGSKRGSVEANVGDDDDDIYGNNDGNDELMELDDDEYEEGAEAGGSRGGKRTSRRKL